MKEPIITIPKKQFLDLLNTVARYGLLVGEENEKEARNDSKKKDEKKT